jgi:hypothetical protein
MPRAAPDYRGDLRVAVKSRLKGGCRQDCLPHLWFDYANDSHHAAVFVFQDMAVI